MKKLIACLEELRSKLARLRKDDLKETPTRTIFVDMVLDALGWDVRDPLAFARDVSNIGTMGRETWNSASATALNWRNPRR